MKKFYVKNFDNVKVFIEKTISSKKRPDIIVEIRLKNNNWVQLSFHE